MQDNQNMSKRRLIASSVKSATIRIMIYFGLIFLEILILFLLSRKMSRVLSRFISINFLFFLFLPGVIIHEFSHLLMAVILFVPVGNMEFTPKVTSGGLKLGSIEISKTDPVRRCVIGFSPVFVGLMLVISIVYFFTSNILFFKDKDFYILGGMVLGVAYLLFAVGNTMFASSRDMEGTIEILIALLIIFIISYIIGFRPPLSFVENLFTKELLDMIGKSAMFLSAPIAIDIVILGTIKIIQNLKVKSQK